MQPDLADWGRCCSCLCVLFPERTENLTWSCFTTVKIDGFRQASNAYMTIAKAYIALHTRWINIYLVKVAHIENTIGSFTHNDDIKWIFNRLHVYFKLQYLSISEHCGFWGKIILVVNCLWEFPQKRKTNTFSMAALCYRRPPRPEGTFCTVVGLIYQLCGGSPCQAVSCTFNLVSTGSHQLKRLISLYIPHHCLRLSVCLSVFFCLSPSFSLSLLRAHTHTHAHTRLYSCFNRLFHVSIFFTIMTELNTCMRASAKRQGKVLQEGFTA